MTDIITGANLVTSKYYALCRSEPLLPHLVPPLPVMMATEQELKETDPREDDNTTNRIFVHYTNSKGNSLSFKVEDHLKFERGFDIDQFLSGYATSIEDDLKAVGGNEITSMQFVTISVLSYAMGIVFGFEKDRSAGRLKTTCTHVFQAIIACLYDSSKDVMIFCRDGKPREDGEKQIVITNMWSMSKQ